MSVHFADGICSLFLAEAQRHLVVRKKPLPPGTGDRGKSVPTAVFWGGIPSVFFDRRNLINYRYMPISTGAHKCQNCTLALH